MANFTAVIDFSTVPQRLKPKIPTINTGTTPIDDYYLGLTQQSLLPLSQRNQARAISTVHQYICSMVVIWWGALCCFRPPGL